VSFCWKFVVGAQVDVTPTNKMTTTRIRRGVFI
jgi:hypothetical protein